MGLKTPIMSIKMRRMMMKILLS
jgi:hypothetical protein